MTFLIVIIVVAICAVVLGLMVGFGVMVYGHFKYRQRPAKTAAVPRMMPGKPESVKRAEMAAQHRAVLEEQKREFRS